MDLFAPTHLILLLMVILIIFGPSKLGDVGGALGKGIRDFKRAINGPVPLGRRGLRERRASSPLLSLKPLEPYRLARPRIHRKT